MIARQQETAKLIEAAVKLNADAGTMSYLLKIQKHLKLPMSVVLKKVHPELSVLDKCKRLGVARSTYYSWLNGTRRPDSKLARKLAKLTGYDVNDIRGRMPAQS